MKLSNLLTPWFTITLLDCDVTGLQNDSRQVKPGDLFFAYPGASADGRMYIDAAREAGAVAVVYDPNNLPASIHFPNDMPCIPISQLAEQSAAIADAFYAHSASMLTSIGVTGTNGKTTIAYQLAQAYEVLGKSTAYIGTLGHGRVHSLSALPNTTPDALCLHRLCHEYYRSGIKQVALEVSSHALVQHRVDYIPFTQAIYTNLSHEHLDYHQTMAAYAAAKALLFATPSLKWAILNGDDPYVATMAAACSATCQQLTYGLNDGVMIQAIDIHFGMTGSTYTVKTPWGSMPIQIKTLGLFNIYNSLAVLASLLVNGYALHDIAGVMAQLEAAPGRMEVVAHEPCVIVDYAHTPDALENVLKTLDVLKQSHIWVVFGCGGDRDRSKRPLMGKIASDYADHVIITNDNPRTEDPNAIIGDILAGITRPEEVIAIPDRKLAIQYVLEHAAAEDVILIAGKGHEQYQQIGETRYDFSDQMVVANIKRDA